MELWELAAREAIRETVARYAHLVDRERIDELLELFAEDGVLEAGERPPARGRGGLPGVFLGNGERPAAAAPTPPTPRALAHAPDPVTRPHAGPPASAFLA